MDSALSTLSQAVQRLSVASRALETQCERVQAHQEKLVSVCRGWSSWQKPVSVPSAAANISITSGVSAEQL